jgi:hypothetical protein
MLFAVFELRDIRNASRQFESARLELLPGQYELCLPFVFENAPLAIPDGHAHVLVSITPYPAHHGFTLLSFFCLCDF